LKLENVECKQLSQLINLELKKEEPRGGKRKPIIDDEEEEELKMKEDQQQLKTEDASKDENETVKVHQEVVIRAPQTQQVAKILADYNTTLNVQKTAIAGQTKTEVKAEAQKRFVIKRQTISLFLQSNKLKSITGLSTILSDVMWNHGQLQWIDLSYNQLPVIDDEILNFPCLKVLYLHGNHISNLEETRKLQGLS